MLQNFFCGNNPLWLLLPLLCGFLTGLWAWSRSKGSGHFGLDGVTGALGAAGDKLKATAEAGLDGVSGVATAGLGAAAGVAGAAAGLASGVGAKISDAAEAGLDAASNVADKAKDLAGSGIDAVTGVAGKAGDLAGSGLSAATDAAGAVKDAAGGAAGKAAALAGAGVAVAAGAAAKAKGAAKKGADAAVDVGTKATSKAKDAVGAGADAAAAVAGKATGKAKGVAKAAAGLTAIGIAAAVGDPDDLLIIKGVGPKLNTLLKKLGITRFDQIAKWKRADVAKVDEHLEDFQGRIDREEWIPQAKLLAAGNNAEWERLYGTVKKAAAGAVALTAIGIPAAIGNADNLLQIKGIGPKLNKLLISLGVTRFDQIAAWGPGEVDKVDDHLGTFKSRIGRDNWVEQAGLLATGAIAQFEAKFGKLDSENK